jgi:drug/metabolite transporter (DMT)-like permease
MLWFFLSLGSALFLSTTDALSKKALQLDDEYIVAWVRMGYALPFLLLFLPFVNLPHLDRTFWIATFFSVPLEVVALLFYVKAIKISPLSLTIPFLAMTPAFLIITGYVVLGEKPDLSGFLGILMVALGAYLLNINQWQNGWLEPLKTLKREKGSLLMLIVAFIYSITTTLGKKAVLHSSSVVFAIVYTSMLTLVLFPIAQIRSGRGVWPYAPILPRNRLFWFIGLFYASMLACQYYAYSLTQASYVISVKRLSLILSIIYGGLFFKEGNLKERLLGGTVMLTGVVLITVF